MIIDVVYVTYSKDLDWFRQSLRVLRHNLKGYRDIHVMCPTQDEEAVRAIVGGAAHVHGFPDWPGHNYIWQQYRKLHADLLTDADYLLLIDSDVMVAKPTHVDDFFVNGKPGWLWSWYTDLGDTVPWKAVTEAAIKEETPREFMRAMPFVLHPSTFAYTRMALCHIHGALDKYMRAVRQFSEFNVMGHIAYRLQEDKYTFIDRNRLADGTLSAEHWPKGIYNVRHYWSHSPLKDQMDGIEAMITGEDVNGLVWTNMGICVLRNDSHISRWVEQHGRLDFDGPFLEVICAYLQPGDVVVDVGAFIGDHTEAYAKAVRGVDGGRVYAFEPNALPFAALTENMKGHGHVECINKGLGSEPGSVSIAQDPNVGASHLVEGTDVEVITLDSLDLQRCRLIKIDAEGFELFILNGAEKTITRCLPVLVLEMNAGALARFGITYDDIAHWLIERNYTVVHLVGNEAQHDIICVQR
jgi:FkbM family methyltransferase